MYNFWDASKKNVLLFSKHTSTPAVPLAPHLHYKLDETSGAVASDDSANSFDGTLQNMEDGDWGPGSLGGALTFGGTDEDILVNHAGALDFEWNDPFTIHYRVKHNQSTLMAVIGKLDLTGGINRGISSYIFGGYVVFQITNSSVGSTYLSMYNTVADLNDNAWHTVSFTYNGNGKATGVTMYVDGAFRASSVGSDTLGAPTTIKSSNRMHIGSDQSAGNYLTGSLDDIQIFPECLSSTQISALHAGTPALQETTTVEDLHMLFDETSGGTAQDQSSNRYSGVGTNITWGAGKIDNAATFNGTTSFLDLGHVLSFERTDAFSLSFWFNGSGTNNESIFVKMQSSGNYRGWRLKINVVGHLQLEMLNTGANAMVVSGSTSIRDGSWHHCVITYDGSGNGSGVNIYVDNSDETENVAQDTLVSTTVDLTKKLFIGVYESVGERLNAALDDIRVIPSVLTSAQRSFLYNSGDGTSSPLPV